MPSFAEGMVTRIEASDEKIVHLKVSTDEGEMAAVAFPEMIGPLEVGNRVVLNTTGLTLDLGTGGTAFVLWNLDVPGPSDPGDGHIVKLRYTPWQKNVVSVESQESPHHDKLRELDTIEGMPVVACGLHSQVAAVAAGIKSAAPEARVGYLMTDGAALPIAWSRLVKQLKEKGLVDVTATCGHAFGGDFEAVNVFSGLAALRAVGEADVVIAALGPGVVGTGTLLGHTALEQGQILDAANALGGRAVMCLRISFADERDRHRGVGHHSLAALDLSAREPCTVVVPELGEDTQPICDELHDESIDKRHEIETIDGRAALEHMASLDIEPTSMGRTVAETPELFLAAGAAGIYAGSLVAHATPEKGGPR
jgi:Protein of unknown function (DUF3866)